MPTFAKKKNAALNVLDVQVEALVVENVVTAHIIKLIYICESESLAKAGLFLGLRAMGAL